MKNKIIIEICLQISKKYFDTKFRLHYNKKNLETDIVNEEKAKEVKKQAIKKLIVWTKLLLLLFAHEINRNDIKKTRVY